MRSRFATPIALTIVAMVAATLPAGMSRAKPLQERALLVIEGAPDDRAGVSLAPVGDFNGDGVEDLIIGTKRDRAYVVFGGETGDVDLVDLGDRGVEIIGEQGSRFGATVAGAGDIDDDGVADVLVGAPRAGFNGLRAGAAYVVFGREDPPRSISLNDDAASIFGAAPGDNLGRGIASAGDFDGDGNPDVAVGAPRAEGSGAAYIIDGETLEPGTSVDLVDFDGTVLRGPSNSLTGWSAASTGDMNDDDLGDIVIGAPFKPHETDAGRAFVVFGREQQAEVELGSHDFDGWTIHGRKGDSAGYAVAGGGDMDGDEVPDVVVGAPRANEVDGRAYIVLGHEDEDDVLLNGLGTNGIILRGTDDSTAGTAVAFAHEVPEREGPGVIVGAPNDTSEKGTGAGYLVSPRGDRAEELGRLGGDGIAYTGAPTLSFLGTAVAGLDDFHPTEDNALAFGAPGADQDGERGRVFIVKAKRPPFADPPPGASLISYGTTQKGEIGSSCWDGLCIDRIPAFPRWKTAHRTEEANIRIDFSERPDAASIHAYRRADQVGQPGAGQELRLHLVKRKAYDASGSPAWDAVFDLPRWKKVYLVAFARWPGSPPRDAFWFFRLRLQPSHRTYLRRPPALSLHSGGTRQRGQSGSYCWSFSFSYGIGVGECADVVYDKPAADPARAGARAFFRVHSKYRPDRFVVRSYDRADTYGFPESPTLRVPYRWRKVRREGEVVAHDAVFHLPEDPGNVFFETHGAWRQHGGLDWYFHLRLH